jgi:flagellar biosynthetic protein FliR
MIFDTVTFGGNLVGNFMGFAAASTFDPHQETQTQIVSQLQMAIAMLIFLVVDGHHLMLRASLDSYRIVGLGGANLLHNVGLNSSFSQRIIEISGQVVRFGIQLAAPIAVSMFAVNVAFGVIAKSMPQLNILVLSFAVSAVVGLVVMFLGLPEFTTAIQSLVDKMGDWMEAIMVSMAS